MRDSQNVSKRGFQFFVEDDYGCKHLYWQLPPEVICTDRTAQSRTETFLLKCNNTICCRSVGCRFLHFNAFTIRIPWHWHVPGTIITVNNFDLCLMVFFIGFPKFLNAFQDARFFLLASIVTYDHVSSYTRGCICSHEWKEKQAKTSLSMTPSSFLTVLSCLLKLRILCFHSR